MSEYAYLSSELGYSSMYQCPIYSTERFYSKVQQLVNAAQESTI